MSETRKRTRPIAVRPTNKERKRGQNEARERGLDETLAETFPASDPLSTDPDPAVEAEDEKIAS